MKDRPESGDIVFLSDETGSVVSAGIFGGFTDENENEYTAIETLTGVVRETVYSSDDPAVAGFGTPATDAAAETAPEIPGGTAASDEPAIPDAPVMPEMSAPESAVISETVAEAPEMPEAADETTAAEAVTADETTSAETTAETEAVTAEDTETAAETSAAEETHAKIPAEPADETTAVAETETGTAESETAADETAPEETAAETTAGGTTEAETAGIETTAAETVIAETTSAETATPDTTAPETTEAETIVPETAESETAVPETDVPEEPEYAAALPAQKFEYRIGGVTVKAAADEGAFPEGTTMSAEKVTERSVIDAASDMVDGRIVGVRAYDIRFLDAEGAEIEPLIPIRVKILSDDPVVSDTQTVVHVADDGSAEIVEQPDEFAVPMAAEEIVFDAGEFSVYAVVYTVDFEYGDYEYSMDGGSVITLSGLLSKLQTELDMNDIDDVSFSDSSLVHVAYISESDTVGSIVDRLGLNVEYNASMTPEDITALRAETVPAGEWLIISLKPFDSEEKLTIRMKNGEEIVVKVTDSQTSIGYATIHYGYMDGDYFTEFTNAQFTPPSSGFGNPAYLIYDVPGYQYAGVTYYRQYPDEYMDSWYVTEVAPIRLYNSGHYYVTYEPRPAATPGGNSSLADDYPDVPSITKSSTENTGTGTNTISLEVTGKRKTSKAKADIIVIYDVSGSMKFPIGFNSLTDVKPGEDAGIYVRDDTDPEQRNYIVKDAVKKLASAVVK